jgi:hypothetical protein
MLVGGAAVIVMVKSPDVVVVGTESVTRTLSVQVVATPVGVPEIFPETELSDNPGHNDPDAMAQLLVGGLGTQFAVGTVWL